jgi:hypothetical protein
MEVKARIALTLRITASMPRSIGALRQIHGAFRDSARAEPEIVLVGQVLTTSRLAMISQPGGVRPA